MGACKYCGLDDGTQISGQSVANPACRDVQACNRRTGALSLRAERQLANARLAEQKRSRTYAGNSTEVACPVCAAQPGASCRYALAKASPMRAGASIIKRQPHGQRRMLALVEFARAMNPERKSP